MIPGQYSDPSMTAWPTLLTRSARPAVQAAGAALRAAAGTRCHVCDRWQGDWFCTDCRGRFLTDRSGSVHRCRCCARRLTGMHEVCGECTRHPPAFGSIVTAVDYDYPWDGLVSRFKFRQHCELAAPLAGLLADAVKAAHHADPAAVPDLVLPVPLAAGRLRERGYNQAWELARRIASALALPASATAVERVLPTPHQVGLRREARLLNLRGAFLVTPRGQSLVAGRSVAIVDDVMTTGATAQALAATLKRAGAREVRGWMLARTMSDDPAP